MTEKSQNYTEEQTNELVSAFSAIPTDYVEIDNDGGVTEHQKADKMRADVVQQFANKLKKEPRSIVSKLVFHKVYVKPMKVTKLKANRPTKKNMVSDIAAQLHVDLDGLNNSSYKSLEVLHKAVIVED